MNFWITKKGFKERIARNMGIDPIPNGRTREGIIRLMGDEAREQARAGTLFDEALAEMVKEGILIREKNGNYNVNLDNEMWDF
jgi:hypothetical protein